MRRVLVTGHRGFIGSNLVKHLASQSHIDVHCLNSDLRVHDAVEKEVKDFHPDIVYHLASYGNSPSHNDRERIYNVNVVGTSNILNATPANSIFVYASTSSVYGSRESSMTEHDPPNPNSHYAISKLCAEQMIHQTRPATILRLFSVYGPGEADYRLIPTVRRNLLAGQPITLASTVRDFVYIDDVVRAIIQLADQNTVINIGTGEQTYVPDVLDIMSELTGIKPVSVKREDGLRNWESKAWVADMRKAGARGWRPAISLRDGLKKYLESF